MFFLLEAIAIVIFLYGFHVHIPLLMHIGGITLTARWAPDALAQIWPILGYALALYYFNPWYEGIYWVSCVYTASEIVVIILMGLTKGLSN